MTHFLWPPYVTTHCSLRKISTSTLLPAWHLAKRKVVADGRVWQTGGRHRRSFGGSNSLRIKQVRKVLWTRKGVRATVVTAGHCKHAELTSGHASTSCYSCCVHGWQKYIIIDVPLWPLFREVETHPLEICRFAAKIHIRHQIAYWISKLSVLWIKWREEGRKGREGGKFNLQTYTYPLPQNLIQGGLKVGETRNMGQSPTWGRPGVRKQALINF